jgi:HAMP domain-containing protein
LIVRRLIVVAAALLLAVQVVRNAAVDALAPLRPGAAAKVWAGHPSVEISLGLAEIGKASAGRKPIAPSTFAMVDDAALKAPLSPDPFLVRGVQAQVAGDMGAAKRAFLAAQWRDPRSMPAAYFLANYYFRSGDTLEGLQQTVVLARLSPRGAIAAAPFIAAYASDRRNWPLMRELFRRQGWLEEAVLAKLADDARNTDAILALADAKRRTPDSAWLRPLLSSLVSSGDYARARAIWSSIGRAQAGSSLIFDPGFSQPDPPAPFNWSLASSTVGLAERQPGGRLHVIFYGNEDGCSPASSCFFPPEVTGCRCKSRARPCTRNRCAGRFDATRRTCRSGSRASTRSRATAGPSKSRQAVPRSG